MTDASIPVGPVKELVGTQLAAGARAALPIVLGFIPVGIAYGVLARAAGLSTLETTLMSLLVFAGASQFIAVGMFAAGATIIPIVFTTLLVNLRHLLMSSTIACHIGKQSRLMLLALGFELTDESFGVAMCDPSRIEGRPYFLLGLQATTQAAWVTGSLLGALAGALVDSTAYGIPFALPALFICLLILQLKSATYVVVMLLAGAFALVFKSLLPGNWYIVLAALPSALIGFGLSRPRREEAAP
jgi:4-azaleucine resistance transporter AzlC